MQNIFNLNKDLLHRLLYSTDASAYREIPIGVYYPKDTDDLISIVKYALEHGISLIPRAAGTSLAGQVVGNGLVVDISKHLNKIIEVNLQEKWVRVQPGVVLDQLNLHLKSFGLFFGPETSTSNRCCMAGMVGNNSCGSHSLVYGSTRDHLIEAEVILADGSKTVFKSLSPDDLALKLRGNNFESTIYKKIIEIVKNEENTKEIENAFPDRELKRRNTGYALDELLYDPSFNLCKILAGSEGTLAIISELKLNLVPLPPKEKCVICAHSNSLDDVFKANLIALKHKPVAVEMMDKNILELSKNNISQNKNRFFVNGDPAAILIIEMAFDSIEELEKNAQNAVKELTESGLVYYCSKVYGSDIPRVWELRKAGLGLLSSMSGDIKPVSVIEDTAVAPYRLPDYMKDFGDMLKKYNLSCVYHAHIGTGELHLRPLLNLKKSGDVELFRTIAHETALLVKKHKGSLSGEHGDGRLRGEFIPLMYGNHVFGLMKRIKKAFDPKGVFNRNKIIDTPAMNSSLRYIPDRETLEYKTYFDYSAQGGWLRAIEQCNGSGDCRKAMVFGGTMCPSFRLTEDEKDTTRARANILRELLAAPYTKKVFDQKEISEVLDLCISCKACKSECPSNIDMARYKAEFLQHHYDVSFVPFRSYMVANMAKFQKIASYFPNIYNYFICNNLFSSFIKKILKFSVYRNIPKLSQVTLKKYASKSGSKLANDNKVKKVYLFADEFTNYNEAEIGICFINLLNSLGYQVIVPKHYESGRAAISKGLLKKAKALAIKNVISLKDIVSQECPIVGIEPSCILSFRDEYPDLVGDELRADSLKLAQNSLLYDEFIMKEVKAGRILSSSFTDNYLEIKLHGHCHQKSLASVNLSAQMLSLPVNYKVDILPTGCCGMAGAFGYEKEHFDVSMKIGEQVLFPEVRMVNSNIEISAPGTSCRQQIKDGTGRDAKHPISILYHALK